MSAPQPKRGGRPKGPRPKHIPQRMCVACRGHDAKHGLIRIVRAPDGAVRRDPTGRAHGRGAYLCHPPACWDTARSAGLLSRALRAEIDDATVADLRGFAATLPRDGDEPAAAANRGGMHT